MSSVNEKSPYSFSLAFKDANGDPAIPTTVEYRIDNMTAGTEVADWADAGTPAASMALTIAGSNHIIADQDNIYEKFRITVRVDNGLPGEAYQDHFYKVVNMLNVVTAD